MLRYIKKELESKIKKYLKIRKVLRIVELVGVIIVILIALLKKLSISEAILSLLAVSLILEYFITIRRWGVKNFIKLVEIYFKEELKDNLDSKQGYEKMLEELISKESNPLHLTKEELEEVKDAKMRCSNRIINYENACKIFKNRLKKLEDLKRLVIF